MITKAELNSFSRSRKSGGTSNFTAPLTAPVMKALGLSGDIPDWGTSMDAGDIDLHATKMLMQSSEGSLANYQVEVSVSRVNGFEIVRLETKGKRGKGYRLELNFKVTFADPQGCKFLEEYMLHAGSCTLTVEYNRAAVQAALVPDGVQAPDQQGVLDGVAEEEAANKKKAKAN